MEGIDQSREIWPSLIDNDNDAIYGEGVYGTAKGPALYTKEDMLKNNYGQKGVSGKENSVDYVIEIPRPRYGQDAAKQMEAGPNRDVQIISKETLKLQDNTRMGTYEEMQETSFQRGVQDAAMGTLIAAVAGAVIGFLSPQSFLLEQTTPMAKLTRRKLASK